MIVTVRDRILSGMRAGRTVEQIVASKPTAEFDAAYGGRPPEGLVKALYQQLAKN